MDKFEKHLLREVSDTAIENFFRDTLSMTDLETTQSIMWQQAKLQFRNLKKPQFNKIWKELVKDKFLLKVGKNFKWEI